MSQTRRICNFRTQGRTRERRTLGRALALTQPKTQNTQHTNIKRNEHVTGLQFGTDGSADPWWSTAQHKYGVEMCTRLSWARASSWAILNCCFAVSSIHTRGGGQERRANLLLHFPVSMETDEGRNRPNELPHLPSVILRLWPLFGFSFVIAHNDRTLSFGLTPFAASEEFSVRRT